MISKRFLIIVALAAIITSCQTVSQLDQVRLTRPGCQFNERGARANECGIVSQIERGRLSLGGASSASGSC